MSNQPSTSAAPRNIQRQYSDPDSDSDDGVQGETPTQPTMTPAKTQSVSQPPTEGGYDSDSSEDNEEAPTPRRLFGRALKVAGKKRHTPPRSKKGRFMKKPKATVSSNGSSDHPRRGEESESGEEEDSDSHQVQPRRKGRFTKAKPRMTRAMDRVMAAEKEKINLQARKIAQKKREQWEAAEAAQAARDRERLAPKPARPLNPFCDRPRLPTIPEPRSPPPPLDDNDPAVIARRAKEHDRKVAQEKRREKSRQILEQMRQRQRDASPPSTDDEDYAIRAAPSTRAVDREGLTTNWEERKYVLYCDPEKSNKKRKTKQIRPLHPRTGPPPNKGIFAVESRRKLEQDPNSGFHYVSKKIKKKEESDTDKEEDEDLLPEEPKNRNHSAATRETLERAFEEAQYLDEVTKKRIARLAKISLGQTDSWFANRRRKARVDLEKGRILELPPQMKMLEEMNKKREERGENLRMPDVVLQPDSESDDEPEEESEDDTLYRQVVEPPRKFDHGFPPFPTMTKK